MAAHNSENRFDSIISAAADEARNRQTFFSFGNEGLTASVSSYGRLLRISQHFPGQKTGFSVDPRDMPEPYHTKDRMEWFLHLADNDFLGGIGPCLQSRFQYAAPERRTICDRWPTFSWSSENFDMRVGYVASAGTIYQSFEFFCADGFRKDGIMPEDELLAGFALRPDLMIRDLDFVDKENEFNKASATETLHGNVYETKLSNTEQNSITRTHEMGDKGIVLHIHVLSEDGSIVYFEPGRSTGSSELGELTEPAGESYFGVRRDPKITESKMEHHRKGPVFKFVLAYTLKQIPTCSSLPTWKTFCGAEKLLQDEKASLSKDQENTLSTNPALDFFMKRNLEYILSVCSVPIPGTIEDGVSAVALTCGDVEGHRVATAASFYAFQILLIALRSFMVLHSTQGLAACNCGPEPQSHLATSYVCLMKTRIERVCKGHIKWVFRNTRGSAGISCPNHWTSGEEIQGWESNEWLPKRSLVDAPFQLIKAGDLYELLETLPRVDLDAAYRAFKIWIHDLKTIDKLDFSAFPSTRPAETGNATETFYFTDHALIWRAVKAAESMWLKLDGGENEKEKYSADVLRKNIIKRFTTEHPVLKKRMIATKRTCTRTRFLLRSKDTFLVRAMDEGLFDNVNPWRNTIDFQQYHERNDDTKWEDPRRFALSIALARHNNRIKLSPGKEMLPHAIFTLFRSSSANGLFAGKLDASLSPIMYDSDGARDDYWAVVFEVPYLLWKFYRSGEINDELTSDSRLLPESINDRLDSVCNSVDNITRLLGDMVVQQADFAGQKTRSDYSMNDDFPFNNIIAEERIVELQDEWLYNSPSFFAQINEDNVACSPDQTHGNGAKQSWAIEKNGAPYYGFLVDVPDRKLWKRKEAMTDDFELRCFTAPMRAASMMGRGRTAKHAKKRFWAFVSQSPLGNEECTKTVFKEEVREKREMNRFFRRHESYDNFFTEQIEPQLNLWTTEFHMSFGRQTIAMGFRFEGDFFDRSWTCRYVEADPQGFRRGEIVQDIVRLLDTEYRIMDHEHDDETRSTSNRGDWDEKRLRLGPCRQRRVLELRLFRRIIKRMIQCAKESFDWAKGEVDNQKKQLGVRLGRLDKQRPKTAWRPFGANRDSQTIPIVYKNFVDTIIALQNVQTELQKVGADFEENRAKINLWLGREQDRQDRRPQWTFSDEARYGMILSRLLVRTKHSIQDLEWNYTNIEGLYESITKELEVIRSRLELVNNDKEQRRAEEMALFTYVTAVFLPLGFATGLYSMSGVPDGKTFGTMFGTFLGVLLLVALIFLRLTKRGPFGERPWFPWPTSICCLSLKADMDEESASEEVEARTERNSSGQANTTDLRRPYSAAGVFSFPKRRPSQMGDIERIGSAANAAD